MKYSKIIIGAGLYGLYSAELCGRNNENVLVLECDEQPFMRATYINQARVHMGYHYPRSYSTAIKSRKYFDRFVKDYDFCIKKDFKKVYATSKDFSWTNAEQFEKFCKAVNIKCEKIDSSLYFKNDTCDGVFETEEYTYDAKVLRQDLLNKIEKMPNVKIKCNANIVNISKKSDCYSITLKTGEVFETEFLLNTTYASINQILNMVKFEPVKIKYELCEIILCKVSDNLKNVGITVMDGPFFSIMPFGQTGLHSLTSVTFTPHITSYDNLPTFICQQKCEKGYCIPEKLGNCNDCIAKPKSAWDYMSKLARKYLSDDIKFEYHSSLFSMKPILKNSEIDDSRPTVIKTFSQNPTFISVLSGKINTVYDLDEYLKGEE
ncbi:MAG: NAD(P)/FAD-dependent oxidoreductase [Clostridia bacterium]|nr:NAD(P)/FAD-dependent oxidoreductase [Clostridia bacterium]